MLSTHNFLHIHFGHLPRTSLWWQQANQGSPEVIFPKLQLFLGDTRHVNPPACPGFAHRSPWHVQKDSKGRHLGGILIRCSHHHNWYILTKRSSRSSASSFQTPELQRDSWYSYLQQLIHNWEWASHRFSERGPWPLTIHFYFSKKDICHVLQSVLRQESMIQRCSLEWLSAMMSYHYITKLPPPFNSRSNYFT